jgi:dCMP deaminase
VNNWDRYFLTKALHAASMSKDPDTQVGAVIVTTDRSVLTDGFNGLPRGIIDLPERLHNKEEKLRLMVHAEMNAVLNAARYGISLKGAILYLACQDAASASPRSVELLWGGPPCVRCTVELIQTGIVEIVAPPFKKVSRWLEDVAHSRELLKEAGIAYREIT